MVPLSVGVYCINAVSNLGVFGTVFAMSGWMASVLD